MEIKRCFFSFPRVKYLIHHQKSHPVGQFQKFWRWRIMCYANSVAACLLKHFELAFGSADIESSSQRAKVVMLIDALNSNMFSIYKKPFVRIKFHLSNTKPSFIPVDNFTVLSQSGYSKVEIWSLRWTRPPEFRIFQINRNYFFIIFFC